MEKVKAYWSIKLLYDCPFCDEEKNYLGTDDCGMGGFEDIPKLMEKGNAKIICDDCGKDIDLEIQEGNDG